MEKIGIDVHKKESQLCIITEEGEVIEQRIRTERGRFAEVQGARGKAKVLMEASTESEWVARCLEELGHEVVVADPNFAPMYGTKTRRVKTDKRDARALADACASGTYREAHRTSAACRPLVLRGFRFGPRAVAAAGTRRPSRLLRNFSRALGFAAHAH